MATSSNTTRTMRSESRELESGQEDNDLEESHSPPAPGRPGRKKNPNSSQAARRDQNRIAQREFRLRKQQRIRDLEARVEILSASKEESFTELLAILRDVMAENTTLRSLVRNLGAFVGDGEGGFLQKLGWKPEDFRSFVDRAETDSAFESYAARKRAAARENKTAEGASPAAGPSTNNTNRGQKRSRTEDSSTDKDKQTSPNTDSPADVAAAVSLDTNLLQNAPYQFPPLTSPQNALWPGLGSPRSNGMFQELVGDTRPMAGSAFSTTLPPPAPAAESFSGFFTEQSPRPAPSAMTPTQFLPPSQNTQPPVSQVRPKTPLPAPADDKFSEVVKLVKYHLSNYRRNPAYCLPQSLRPSLVQRTVEHESVIDEVLHPDLRDSMILLRQRYDLVDCLIDIAANVEIHGDDVLNHNNWEWKESWLRRWSVLVEQPLLSTSNRWRRERGEPELTMVDIKGASKS
ncbi:hypothetical protein SISNIDRAFT_481436 [Sistotremastrum niveocremeum HHB9708]|uniref:BZIP domain-containing protein n=1 Tax=Sistotremastrum niveocremeum HHB9708 TaxID=1314777 RepID=A0A164Z3N7_9AGAM|nr:hypothetical protein SISNIDRAFT_481436 [Sistotremastrum niveocremeum HHB9708]